MRRRAKIGPLYQVLGLVLGLGLSGVASGKPLRWTHYGLRPLAMGNAFVSVADDHNALFYNPAGLARLKDWDIEILNVYGEVSSNTVTAIKDFTSLLEGGMGDTDAVLDFLEGNTGKTHHFALGLTPHFVMNGFGLAIGVDLGTSLAFHREIAADVEFGPRVIMPVSFAANFLDDRLSVGGSIKVVARGGVDREFSINDIQAFADNDDKKDSGGQSDEDTVELSDFFEGGTGVGVDVGLLFTPIETLSPTIGLSITDVGGTPYKKFDLAGEALGAPKSRLPSVNTGISLVPYRLGSMYILTAIEAHALNQPVHYSKKFNLGAEWGYGDIIKIQGGLYQGALSGGFQFDVMLFSARFVTYTEQLGTIAGQNDNLQDRRYALQLKLLI